MPQDDLAVSRAYPAAWQVLDDVALMAIYMFRKAWIKAWEPGGCPGKIPHDVRRTAVRNLVHAGVPDTIAMKLTGHKTRAIFDRYDITSEQDLAEATRKLQALAGTFRGE